MAYERSRIVALGQDDAAAILVKGLSPLSLRHRRMQLAQSGGVLSATILPVDSRASGYCEEVMGAEKSPPSNMVRRANESERDSSVKKEGVSCGLIDYALKKARKIYRGEMRRLYALMAAYNNLYFNNLLPDIILSISAPRGDDAVACVNRWDGPEARYKIRIRPSFITGSDPYFNNTHQAEGRRRFIDDLLLHECVHVLHLERDYYGTTREPHGALFADECNRIGALIGTVRDVSALSKKRDSSVPLCPNWPHNVRPTGYYFDLLAREKFAY